MQALETRIAALERKNRIMVRAAMVLLALAFGLALWGTASASSDSRGAEGQVLRVKTLEIVDANGIVRVRVGSDLPDAIIDGKRIGRGGDKVAGVMLYDGSGQERGGYVTFEPSGNIGLTLDSKKGQVALFAAGPEGSPTLRLWNGDDAIELRSDTDGSRLTSISDGTIDLQLPEVETMVDEACNAYRNARDTNAVDDAQKVCSARFPSSLCRECLAD